MMEFGLPYAKEHGWMGVEVWLPGPVRVAVGSVGRCEQVAEGKRVGEMVQRGFLSRGRGWKEQLWKQTGAALAVPVFGTGKWKAALVLRGQDMMQCDALGLEKLSNLVDAVLRVHQESSFTVDDLLSLCHPTLSTVLVTSLCS